MFGLQVEMDCKDIVHFRVTERESVCVMIPITNRDRGFA